MQVCDPVGADEFVHVSQLEPFQPIKQFAPLEPACAAPALELPPALEPACAAPALELPPALEPACAAPALELPPALEPACAAPAPLSPASPPSAALSPPSPPPAASVRAVNSAPPQLTSTSPASTPQNLSVDIEIQVSTESTLRECIHVCTLTKDAHETQNDRRGEGDPLQATAAKTQSATTARSGRPRFRTMGRRRDARWSQLERVHTARVERCGGFRRRADQ